MNTRAASIPEKFSLHGIVLVGEFVQLLLQGVTGIVRTEHLKYTGVYFSSEVPKFLFPDPAGMKFIYKQSYKKILPFDLYKLLRKDHSPGTYYLSTTNFKFNHCYRSDPDPVKKYWLRIFTTALVYF